MCIRVGNANGLDGKIKVHWKWYKPVLNYNITDTIVYLTTELINIMQTNERWTIMYDLIKKERERTYIYNRSLYVAFIRKINDIIG